MINDLLDFSKIEADKLALDRAPFRLRAELKEILAVLAIGAHQKNLELVKHVEEMARVKGVKPGQLALAWVLAQGDDMAPIPGTKRRAYLEENIAAATIKLTPEDLAALDAVLPPGAASGARYPERSLQLVNK